MNTKAEQIGGASAADIAKLALAILILAAGIVGYYYFNDLPNWQRLLAMLATFVAAATITSFTRAGRSMRAFLVESNFELRKVVWPSTQETVRTTLVIIAVVIILSLLLGLIDVTLKWAILDHLLKLGR